MAELLLDRSMGALLGLAVGDALGAPYEGLDRGSYPRVSDYAEGGVRDLPAGGWTDDTAMAICLAESLLARGGVDERDLLERFLRWYRAGENSCTGVAVGISRKTRAVLEGFERTGRVDTAAELENAGNGAIMRLAPVAIFFRRNEIEARRAAVRQARVTHTSEAALAAAECLADLLVVALRTGDPAAVSGAAAGSKTLAEICDHRGKRREQISSAPRAVDTLEAALWCLNSAAGFEQAAIEAVNLGGDTDTIGAVAGQLAGAIFGASAIPPRWLAELQSCTRLEDLARRLDEQGTEVVA